LKQSLVWRARYSRPAARLGAIGASEREGDRERVRQRRCKESQELGTLGLRRGLGRSEQAREREGDFQMHTWAVLGRAVGGLGAVSGRSWLVLRWPWMVLWRLGSSRGGPGRPRGILGAFWGSLGCFLGPPCGPPGKHISCQKCNKRKNKSEKICTEFAQNERFLGPPFRPPGKHISCRKRGRPGELRAAGVRRQRRAPWRLFDLIVWNDLDEVQPVNSDTALSQGERPD
jgi:hypothetical protein